MKKITAALIGAGNRGLEAYGPYALNNPYKLQFVAVAEPIKQRRDMFQKQHNISDDMCFSSWEEILQKPKLADAILICTQDRMHYEPAIKALEKGYHVLLEKPMSPDPIECITMGEYANKYNRVFAICHVLRYTSFFSTLKQLLTDGRIGKLICIQHNENVGHIHQSHSFVRGNWRNSKETSPMILAKSCHDMDIILWLAGGSCKNISSYGSLMYFNKENAPKGAPKRCLDGCPEAERCPYYAPKIYLTQNTGWPASVISDDTSFEARKKALENGPYGRCVFYCDNDVVDNQVVSMQFDNGVTASFIMCAFTKKISRTIKLMGTKGEIRGSMGRNEIEVYDFEKGTKDVIHLPDPSGHVGHGGGDFGIMNDFVNLVQNNSKLNCKTSANISVQSHLMAFAAEKSRVENHAVNMSDFINEVKNNM